MRKIYFETAIRNALEEAPPIGFTSEIENLRIVERSKGTKIDVEENFKSPVEMCIYKDFLVRKISYKTFGIIPQIN